MPDLPNHSGTLLLPGKRTILLTFAFCFTTLCFSQGDFRKGYIVNSTGDTIFGFVQYKDGHLANRKCAFSENGKETMAIFEPKDIKAYGFANGKAFETRKVKIEDEIMMAVFLEVKIRGLVSLYKYEKYLLVQRNADSLQRLSNDKTEQIMPGKTTMKYSNQHIAILNTLLFDCPELRERTQKVQLVERHITELIEDYNKCMGDNAAIYNATKPWVKFNFGITGGLHMSMLKIESLSFTNIAGTYDMTKTPFLGISMDLLAPRLSEHLSFHSDILYLNPTYRKSNVVRYSTSREENEIRINVHQIKIPIGFRYTFFPQKKTTCYLNIGGSSTLNVDYHSTRDVKVMKANSTDSKRFEDPIGISFHQFGYWAGVGVMKSIKTKLKGFAELRCEGTEDIGDFDARVKAIQSRVTNFQIVLGIRGK